MKYEIVALFDKHTYPIVHELQRNVCRKYKLYKNNNSLYIPIESIYDPELDKLNSVITKILEPYKVFKVKINNSIFLNNQNKQVNLKIDDKGYINRISRDINEMLKLYGFNTQQNDYNNLFLPLASSNYNIKKACNNNDIKFNNSLSKNDYLDFAKIERIEIWKSLNHRRTTVVKSYPLRKY